MHRLSFLPVRLMVVGLLLCALAVAPALACTGPAGSAGPAGPAGSAGPAGEVIGIAGASLVVSPNNVTSGNAFGLTVYVAGFGPEEQVMVWGVGIKGGEDYPIQGGMTSKSGAMTAKTGGNQQVFPDMEPGFYTLKAVGKDSGTVATAFLQVKAAEVAK